MRAWIFVVVACSLLLLGGRAQADEAADEQAAKAAFEEGRRHFHETGDYEAALAAFRETRKLRPHDLVTIAIARSLEKLDRHREALEEWESVLASKQISDEQKRKVDEARARLMPKLGVLRVAGEPAGANVSIDDTLRCTLPCRAIVEPGEHVVIVRQGVRERSERVVLSAGEERTIEASLTKPAVAPTSEPSEASPGPVATGDGAPTGPAGPPDSQGPGALLWVGVAVTVVGVAGVIGFGLHADAKHDDYVATPSDDLRDEGLLARDLSNASIAVAGVGAIMILIDAVFLAPQPVADTRLDGRGLRVAF